MALEPIVFVPDTHAPFHDAKAFDILCRVAKDIKPKHLVILGDFVDFYSVSSHDKDPRRVRYLADELAVANHLLDRLDDLKAANKIYIAGNHEHRLTRYMSTQAPALDGLLTVPGVLRLADRGWRYTPYRHDTRLGKLWLTHDVGVAGRGAVHKALDTYQHSVITAHAHRMGYVVEGNAVGESRVSAQFGWLGDITQIDYMHRVNALKNWALGFGIGHLDTKTRYVYVTPVPLVKHTCVVGRKLYTYF